MFLTPILISLSRERKNEIGYQLRDKIFFTEVYFEVLYSQSFSR